MPRTIVLAATSLVLALGALGVTRVIAVPVSPDVLKQQQTSESRLIEQARRGGGGRVARGGRVTRSARVTRSTRVSRGGNVARRTNVRTTRSTNVRRRANGSVNRRTNVVNRRVVRPVRPWVRRPYYGRVVAGIALGSVIWATSAGIAPAAPGPNLCWYWSNDSKTRGYWDYCTPPG
jgi:hypothetical protein